MKLERGMLISTDNWWYVVVDVVFVKGKTWLYCICDNANNRYAWEAAEVMAYITKDELKNWSYMGREKELPEDLEKRAIPYDVITEVLLGKHDDRFSDYHERNAE
jgi:hypothetical protein